MHSERLLWVLRHAKTEVDPPPGGTDHERRLAARGRRDARALGKRLGEGGDALGLPEKYLPQLILSSTATRTVQTTELVVASMGHPRPIRYLASLYQASPQQVLDEVRSADEGVPSLLVVGHNPTMQDLVYSMVGSKDRQRLGITKRGFSTCGLAVFSFEDLEWSEVGERSANTLGVFFPPF